MNPYHIVIIGASICGNKGAESMLRAGVHHISQRLPNSQFTLLSVFPGEDRELNHDPRITIVPFTPLWLGVILPFCCLYRIFGMLRLSRSVFRRVSAIRALLDADLVVDVAGISFSDGRGIITLYNAVMILPVLLLSRKLIKVSQAVGPFKSIANRSLARACLSRVDRILARGEITRRHLAEIGITDVPVCADVAFAMPVSESAATSAAAYCRNACFDGTLIGVSPSVVVERYCQKHGIDYIDIMARFVDHAIETYTANVVMVTHASRPGHPKSRTNDLPTCRRIFSSVRHQDRCRLIDANCNAEELRYIIGKTGFFLASRFHAMISGLSMGVPTLLVGWSHKYCEVLDMFGLNAWQMDYTALSFDSLAADFDRLVHHADEVKARISEHLPAVLSSSERNWYYAMELLDQFPFPEAG